MGHSSTATFPPPTAPPDPAALRAERDLIERRAYTDHLRLREIRVLLDSLDEDTGGCWT